MLAEGTQASEFTATDQFGTEHTLKGHSGEWLMIYFYPKDDTPGCTKEACAIRDAWTDFTNAGITVLGVSADSEKSHSKFSKKFSLPFPLLSDPEQTMIRSYEATGMKQMYGRDYEGILRVTYLVAPNGTIAKTYPDVKPDTHAAEILKDISILQKR